MAEYVVYAVFVRAKAGKEEELANRLRALVQASRSDAGVVIYDLHQSAEDTASWFLYERYDSEEHRKTHMENPVLRSFLADAARLVDGGLDGRKFKLASE
jgi:quinol monooxygenase YgiN